MPEYTDDDRYQDYLVELTDAQARHREVESRRLKEIGIRCECCYREPQTDLF